MIATAQRYLDTAILAPLETGKLGRGYSTVFASGIRPAALGPDLHALTEIEVGKTKTFTESTTPVALSALFDPSGKLLYAATTFHVKTTATKASGAFVVDRAVELTLEPVDAAWLITAYRTTVKRTTPRPVPRATTTTVRKRRSQTKKP